MEEVNFFAAIQELANTLTVGAILLYLLITERRAHDETRRAYRTDLMRLIQEMNDLLQEIAGIKANMWNVQRYTQNRESDTRPLNIKDSES